MSVYRTIGPTLVDAMHLYYRGYSDSEGKATIPLNTSANGDITIVVYHARSTFGGKIQGKVYHLNRKIFVYYSFHALKY